MTPTRRRGLVVAAAWMVAAVLATTLGLLAVGAIGDGLAGPASRPLSAEEVERELAARSTGVPAPAPAPAPGPADAPQVVGTVAGTVAVRCVDGAARIVSVSPGQGFRVDDHGEHPDRVQFESERVDVQVRLSCRDGVPVADVQEDVED